MADQAAPFVQKINQLHTADCIDRLTLWLKDLRGRDPEIEQRIRCELARLQREAAAS